MTENHLPGPQESSVHLDAIRGFAALVVFTGHVREIFLSSGGKSAAHPVATHASTGIAGGAPHKVEAATTWGHQAVVIFFALSGLLVGGSVIRDLKRGRWSWIRYGLRRLCRLWSVLIPALAIGYMLDQLGLHCFMAKGSIYSLPYGLSPILADSASRLGLSTFFGNLFFLQHVTCPVFGSNDPLWSLSYEFWYYVAFPLLMLAVWKGATIGRRILCGILLIGLLAFVGKTIALYFLIWLAGVLVWVLPKRIPAALLTPVTIAIGVLFIGLNGYLRLKAHLRLEVSDAILAVGCSAFLYCVLHYTRPAQPTLYMHGAHFLSRISYTLYLFHLPLLIFISAALVQPWHPWASGLKTDLRVGAISVGVFLYTVAMYFLFEYRTDSIRRWIELRLGIGKRETEAKTTQFA